MPADLLPGRITEILSPCVGYGNDHLAHLSYLCADSRGGVAQRQDRDILGPVQPVYCHLRAGCPFHHGYVVVPANTDTGKTNHNADILMNCPTAEQLEAAAGKRSRRDLWLLRMLRLDVSRLPYVWISTPKNDTFRAVQVFYLPLLKVIFREETNTEIKNLSSYSVFQEGLKCLELQIYAQVEKKLQTISILSALTG